VRVSRGCLQAGFRWGLTLLVLVLPPACEACAERDLENWRFSEHEAINELHRRATLYRGQQNIGKNKIKSGTQGQ
jgi:hypothetical protein